MVKYGKISKNVKKIKELFPNCATETKDKKGKITLKINFETLKQELSDDIIGENQEKYEFTWPGKKASILLANQPTDKILVPCKEESVNWDTTQNLYIEGDNLDVLKILRRDYLNKIKMIYIDPPYNTGKNRLYKDKFTHSEWLNMMYPRLKLARDFLTNDGVIFISIDDHEVHNLRKLCDEIFGEENFVAQICHKHRDGVSNDKIISSNHNFLLFYCKNINVINDMRNKFGIKRSEIDFKNYNKDDNDGKGLYALNPVTGPGGARKGNPYYEFLGINNYWRFSKERMIKMWKERIIVKLNNNLYQKTYKNDIINTKKNITTWWDTVGTTAKGTKQIKNLFGTICFDFAKPIELVKHILKFIHYQRSDIILDFFSGSATTAHAVMKLNAEDGGNRKFIMVQLPEVCDEKSIAFKEGYKNICEIGKERIRRAGKKIIEETGKTDLDIGFRVLKVGDKYV